jgi:hypothetical protein
MFLLRGRQSLRRDGGKGEAEHMRGKSSEGGRRRARRKEREMEAENGAR